jgi:hypothetical protein
VSGLNSKPLGRFLSVWSQNRWWQVSAGLATKPAVTISGGLASKPAVTVSSGLASKPAVTVSSGLGSKMMVDFFVEPQN